MPYSENEKRITELFLRIKSSNSRLYFRLEDHLISDSIVPYDEKELEEFKKTGKSKEFPKGRLAYNLPSFDEINHRSIMSFFVKECIEDPLDRKGYFSILRRKDYVDAFIKSIKEHGVYDDFIGCVGDLYVQIFDEWIKKYKLQKYFYK